jgi:hypothetical protein
MGGERLTALGSSSVDCGVLDHRALDVIVVGLGSLRAGRGGCWVEK